MKMNKLVFPINISNTHWVLTVAYLEEKRISFLDSLGGKGEKYLRHILDYIFIEAGRFDEYKKKMKKSDWLLESMGTRCPQQQNNFDCGVFVILYADFLSDNLPLLFKQKDIPSYRLKIASSILHGSLPY